MASVYLILTHFDKTRWPILLQLVDKRVVLKTENSGQIKVNAYDILRSKNHMTP